MCLCSIVYFENTCAATLAAHVFSIKNRQNTQKYAKTTKKYYVTLLNIVVIIKYSLLNPRWRKPEVEVVQNRQFITIDMSFVKSQTKFFSGKDQTRSCLPLLHLVNPNKRLYLQAFIWKVPLKGFQSQFPWRTRPAVALHRDGQFWL